METYITRLIESEIRNRLHVAGHPGWLQDAAHDIYSTHMLIITTADDEIPTVATIVRGWIESRSLTTGSLGV